MPESNDDNELVDKLDEGWYVKDEALVDVVFMVDIVDEEFDVEYEETPEVVWFDFPFIRLLAFLRSFFKNDEILGRDDVEEDNEVDDIVPSNAEPYS